MRKILGTVAHTCHPSSIRKPKIGSSQSRPAWAKMRSYLQNNQNRKARGMAQKREQLPQKCRFLFFFLLNSQVPPYFTQRSLTRRLCQCSPFASQMRYLQERQKVAGAKSEAALSMGHSS
jgi:hypothetical protein